MSATGDEVVVVLWCKVRDLLTNVDLALVQDDMVLPTCLELDFWMSGDDRALPCAF